MTHDTQHPDDGAATGKTPPRPGLPLVTVIVVNYNYGRFLEEAVESVFGQTYANIECIVVDNASVDDSSTVLAALTARHPTLILINRDENGGQTAASLDGLNAAKGHYIIFLDADDYLLPLCVETHIYAHLSLRPHAGLTSVDMLQIADREIVLATGEEANRFVKSGRGHKPRLVRPYTATPGWPSAAVKDRFVDKIHYSPPLSTRWIWSPTSGLCYRRDALLHFSDNARLAKLRTCTDMYFAISCGALCGGAVIDEPLFAYRLHGGNSLTARAQLDRTLSYSLGSRGDSNELAQLFIVDHLVDHAARFAPNGALRANLAGLLLRLDRRDPNPVLPGWARRSRAAQAIVRHYASFAALYGAWAARFILICFAKSLRSPESLADSLPEET
ncbi:MAG: glycosyltransferase [Beijerinckiaceae bacterium]|nr:glycosyltransferase [Beijerinckiaceae bacterium]